MKRGRIIFSVLAFTAMLMMLAVPTTATENKLLFVPANSSVLGYGDCVDVDIYTDINETDQAIASQFCIEYDPNCVQDFPSFDNTSPRWLAVTESNPAPGICRFTTSAGLGSISGHIKVGTLTLCCNNTCCGSFLNFTGARYCDKNINTVFPITDNGTFLCGEPSIEVIKTVYEPNAGIWTDNITDAEIGDELRFRINVSTCCDHTGLVVNDTLPVFLTYNDNAIPFDPTDLGGNMYQWTFGMLNKSETMTIEFNATVNDYGSGDNEAFASAWCDEFSVQSSDEDGVPIAAGPAGICGDVNDDGVINMADVMTLWYDYANYPTPGSMR